MKKEKNVFLLLTLATCITSLVLVLFSFTQVDLSLTLSQTTIFQSIQKSFQYIGFYQRPLSTSIYLSLLALLTAIYIISLYFAKKNILKEKHAWILIFVMTCILFFSYPASFSYDIFNYIFTAKTILLYGKNPYIVKPLDFQGIDPMLSFMRWTHLPSAYTPLWIALTLVPYVLSLGILLLAIWTMKIIPIVFYLLSVWSIGKILKKTHPSYKVWGMIAFAFNPLVIVEVLVSAHNDIVMMGIALLAYQFFLRKKSLVSFLLLALSVGIKFITVFLVPLFIWKWSAKKALVLLSGALLLVLMRREFLPWYFLWIIPFVVLIPENTTFIIITGGVSIGLLLRYAPVFYFGNYDAPVPYIQNIALICAVLISLTFAAAAKFRQRKNTTNKR